MRVYLKLIALAEQEKLSEPYLDDLVGQFSTGTGQSFGVALNQFLWPIEVICAVVLALQRPKQRIVFQPVFLLSADLFVVEPQIVPLSGLEVFPSRFEEPGFEGDHSIVVNQIRRKLDDTIFGC